MQKCGTGNCVFKVYFWYPFTYIKINKNLNFTIWTFLIHLNINVLIYSFYYCHTQMFSCAFVASLMFWLDSKHLSFGIILPLGMDQKSQGAWSCKWRHTVILLWSWCFLGWHYVAVFAILLITLHKHVQKRWLSELFR